MSCYFKVIGHASGTSNLVVDENGVHHQVYIYRNSWDNFAYQYRIGTYLKVSQQSNAISYLERNGSSRLDWMNSVLPSKKCFDCGQKLFDEQCLNCE